MTLTYPGPRPRRQLLWLLTGRLKREPLAKLLAGDTSIPAGRVSRRRRRSSWPTLRQRRNVVCRPDGRTRTSELPTRPPTRIVLFGATGDLAARKLIPGFLRPGKVGLMPDDFRIIGTSRRLHVRRRLPRARA